MSARRARACDFGAGLARIHSHDDAAEAMRQGFSEGEEGGRVERVLRCLAPDAVRAEENSHCDFFFGSCSG